MGQPKPEKKAASSTPLPLRVLPMQLGFTVPIAMALGGWKSENPFTD
jgi:hypothetical protein